MEHGRQGNDKRILASLQGKDLNQIQAYLYRKGTGRKGDSTLAHAFKVVLWTARIAFLGYQCLIDCMAPSKSNTSPSDVGVATNVPSEYRSGILRISTSTISPEEIVAKPIPPPSSLALLNLRDGMFESLPYPAITGKIDINDKTVEQLNSLKDAKITRFGSKPTPLLRLYVSASSRHHQAKHSASLRALDTTEP